MGITRSTWTCTGGLWSGTSKRRRRLRVRQQLRNLLPVGDDLVLALDRLAVIAQRLAAGHTQHCQQQGGREQPPAQAPHLFGTPLHQNMPLPTKPPPAIWQILNQLSTQRLRLGLAGAHFGLVPHGLPGLPLAP